MTDIDRIGSYLHGEVPTFEPATLRGIIMAFEESTRFLPTHWGPDERVRKPWHRDDVLRHARSLTPPEGGTINMYRHKTVKYRGYFDVHTTPFLSFDFDRSMSAARWPELLALIDALAAVVHPRLGTVQIFRPPKEAWNSEEDKIEDYMEYCAYVAPVDLRPNGPLGLGMCTYFGGDVLQMFGRELLLSTPGVVTEFDWGGIRIDLTEKFWNAERSELIRRWITAMDHLAGAGAFAKPLFKEQIPSIKFLPSAKWQNRSRAGV
jgi:hypothetical protein